MYKYKKIAVLLFAVSLPIVAFASPAEQLQMAANNGNIAFVLVTEPGTDGVEQATQVIQSTMTEFAESVMITLDRADAGNATLAQEYRLASAPVPLILVFASNGAMAGGNVASKLTSQTLANMVPSPRKADLLKAIQGGQAVLVTASRVDMSSKTDVAGSCAAACGKMMGKCIAVNVDMDDPAEKAFLTQLKVDMQAAEPVTVIINAQGQVTGSFNGPVDVAQLVQTASKKVSSGCCPPGSGKTCPPTPKKKGG